MSNKPTGLEQTQKIIDRYKTKTVKAKTWLDIEAIDRFGTCCIKCKDPVDIDINGMQKVKDGYMCDDCYFEELSNEVEKHPIGPGRRR
jgi:hypothetical protein